MDTQTGRAISKALTAKISNFDGVYRAVYDPGKANPAEHPIRVGLVMGQWEQERFLAAPEAAGFHRGRRAPWSMGFGERRRLPIGAGKARCRFPRHCERDATGERSISLAKIGVVLPRTSCGQRKPVLSCFRTELFASCLMGLLHPQRALPTCNWCFFLLLHCGQGCRVSLGRQCRGRLCPASISPASPTWKR